MRQRWRTDQTNELFDKAAAKGPRFRPLFSFQEFGHQAAVATGLEHATGSVIAIIDGGLQDPPEVIGDLVAALGRRRATCGVWRSRRIAKRGS